MYPVEDKHSGENCPQADEFWPGVDPGSQIEG